ncbi:hypothetical protein [Planotetraspora sp. GP83]|uniref:hypothetical protein n=1 Tax=Planotetraspora sp. GP83 TaxID=3156264 RepID=UPI0035192AAD
MTNIATSVPLPGPLGWIADRPWVVFAVCAMAAVGLGIAAVVLQGDSVPEPPDIRIDERGRTLDDAIVMLDRRSGLWRRDALVSAGVALVRGQSRPTVVYGLPGSGKTILLTQIAKECRSDFRYGICLAFDGYQVEDLGFVLHQLNRFLAGFGRAVDDQDLQQAPRPATLRQMTAELQGIGILVLIDGLHLADATTQAALLGALRGLDGVKVLAASAERLTPNLDASTLHVPELSPEEYREFAHRVAEVFDLRIDVDNVLDKLPDVVRAHPRTLEMTLGYLKDLPLELLPVGTASDSRLVQHMLGSLEAPAVRALTRLSLFHGSDITATITYAGEASLRGLEDELGLLLRRALIDRVQPTIAVPTVVATNLRAVHAATVREETATVTAALTGIARTWLAAHRDLSPLAEVLAAVVHNLARVEAWSDLLELCDLAVLEELSRRGRWDAYLAMAKLGVRAAVATGSVDMEVELRLRIARKLVQLGSFEDAEASLALAAARLGDGDTAVHAHLTSHQGLLALMRGDLESALRSYEKSMRLAQAHGEQQLLVIVSKQLGHVYERAGRPGDAWRAYEWAAAHSGEDSKDHWESLVNLALMDAKNDRFDDAADRIDRAVRGMADSGYDAGIARANLAYAQIALARGNRELALGLVRQVCATGAANVRVVELAAAMLRDLETPE